MDLGNVKRLVWVTVAAALIVGVWASAASAAVRAPKAEPTYSDSDCETIQNIQVDDSSGGYWGKTAINASKEFKGAAQDIDSKKLKKAMTTLAGVWKTVGRETSVIAAAKVTAKIGNKYGNALGTFTKAVVACASQSVSDAFDEPTTTEPLADDSSTTTSSDDGSSSSSD